MTEMTMTVIWLLGCIVSGGILGYYLFPRLFWRRHAFGRVAAVLLGLDLIYFLIAAVYWFVHSSWFNFTFAVVSLILIVWLLWDGHQDQRKRAQRLIGYKAKAILARMAVRTREVYA